MILCRPPFSRRHGDGRMTGPLSNGGQHLLGHWSIGKPWWSYADEEHVQTARLVGQHTRQREKPGGARRRPVLVGFTRGTGRLTVCPSRFSCIVECRPRQSALVSCALPNPATHRRSHVMIGCRLPYREGFPDYHHTRARPQANQSQTNNDSPGRRGTVGEGGRRRMKRRRLRFLCSIAG